jgi:hypothetical protein
MKKIVLGLLLLFNLGVNAQIRQNRIKIGSLKVGDKEVASLIKYEDHYLFRFFDTSEYPESIEFDINDFDKLYQVFTKENNLGIVSDSYTLSLPLTYKGNNTPTLEILYLSKEEKVQPEYHYRLKKVDEKRPEDSVDKNYDEIEYDIEIPNFSKEEWMKIFGK